MKKYSFGLIFGLALVCGLFIPAQARTWKPTPSVQAQEYSEILDETSNGRVVELCWFNSVIFADKPLTAAMLKKYVVIGIADGNIDTASTKPVGMPRVLDNSGKPLAFLPKSKAPIDLVFAIGSMSMTLGRTGFMGHGMQYFVFEAGGVDACKKGGMSISFNGKTYTYQTPIPGCPAP